MWMFVSDAQIKKTILDAQSSISTKDTIETDTEAKSNSNKIKLKDTGKSTNKLTKNKEKIKVVKKISKSIISKVKSFTTKKTK